MKHKNSFLKTAAIALAVVCSLHGARAENSAAVNDVLKLKTAGLADDTLLGFIKSKSVDYDLSSTDILTLNQQGMSPTVLNAMLTSGKNAATPSGTAPVQPGVVATPSSVPTIPAPAPAPAPALLNSGAPPPTLPPDAAYFYQELSPYGRWILAEDNQWHWQPSVALTTPAWRPYWDGGHWVSSDSGWYWSSDYPWGWAAFHYGRWELHPHFGWIWLPDRAWGPAWVTWRSGGEYCGWSALPPGAVFDVTAGRFKFHGRLVAADFDFGLGWMNFNFCYVRELGEPLRWHPGREAEFRAAFEHTKMIAGYRAGRSVINGVQRDHFVNVGIEASRVTELRGRPVETVRVQDLRTPVGQGVHERFLPEEKTLQIYRPRFGRPEERRPTARR